MSSVKWRPLCLGFNMIIVSNDWFPCPWWDFVINEISFWWVWMMHGDTMTWKYFLHHWLFVRGIYPDTKVHGTNMGPTWALSGPDGPHVGSINLAIRVAFREGNLFNYIFRRKLLNINIHLVMADLADGCAKSLQIKIMRKWKNNIVKMIKLRMCRSTTVPNLMDFIKK